ncbi:hypothetical protein [Massilia suwonensis]|uniref:Lipoprotein n=1 Tax=Massilia suwonensis TaxID=648895 RepID=A0ABW0MSM9_9BURK
MRQFMHLARNVEVWIFGAFAGLAVVACLDRPAERTARPASPVSVVRETELAQPQAGAAQPMYVVYVVGKRPSAAEKRANKHAGAG